MLQETVIAASKRIKEGRLKIRVRPGICAGSLGTHCMHQKRHEKIAGEAGE